MRVSWNSDKNDLLKRTRGIGFNDAVEMFRRPYVVQSKNDDPEQYKAIGFAKGGILITLIIEVRYDDHGEYEWLVTLWKATKDEVKIYEQST
jgi:uncharacterized DUF497 family protein